MTRVSETAIVVDPEPYTREPLPEVRAHFHSVEVYEDLRSMARAGTRHQLNRKSVGARAQDVRVELASATGEACYITHLLIFGTPNHPCEHL